VQNNPQYKLKDIRQDLKDQFNLNASSSKLKRFKRMTLQKLQWSFLDDYNRIEAYANELKLRNSGSDIVINLSKDGLEQDKRKILRMYICLNELKLERRRTETRYWTRWNLLEGSMQEITFDGYGTRLWELLLPIGMGCSW